MKKILEILADPMSVGGEESFVSNVLNHINYENISIDIMCPYSCDNIKAINMFNRERNGLFFLDVSYKGNVLKSDIYHPTVNFLKSNQYDVVHIHSCNTSALAIMAFAAKKAGIKRVIVHSHNTGTKKDLKYYALKALFEPLLLSSANDFCACSPVAGEWKFTKNICKNKLIVLKNGIDTELFKIYNVKREEYRTRLGFSDTSLVIGHVGRFAFQKNHEFIIDIFTELHKKNNKYKLLLIGDGELRQSIEEKVNKAGLTDSVIFTGNVNNVQDYMQAMDLFILPSMFEGFGIVGIEAQACGLPCIFSTGVPYEAKLTDNVEFVSLEDKDKWIKTIEEMILLPKTDNTELIRSAGYDIKQTAKAIEIEYLSKHC